jgi:MFS family permease
LQGVVLGAYYYGYIFTNVNAGQLADWFGSRLLCGISILVSGALTLLTPIAAYWSVYAVIVLRVLIGLVQVCTSLMKKN